MKQVKILSFLAFMLVAASCSVHTSLTRTAKVAEITPEIIAMPTVVDFDISDTPVAADTVVTMKLFGKESGYQSKKSLTDALLASVLKSVDADVLMEPKITTQVENSGFSSTVRIELEGYPAKYGKFRTITMEDVEILNALKKENKTGSISMSRFLRTDMGRLYSTSGTYVADPENLVRTTASSVEKVRWRRKKGYKGIYEFGYNHYLNCRYIDSDDVTVSATMYAHISQGALLTPYFYLGGCTGFDVMTDNWDDFKIPVLAHLRVYMLNRRVAPYLDIKAGGSALFYSGEYDCFCANAQAGLGLSVGAFSFGASYDMGFVSEGPNWQTFKFNIAFSF
ncbi:MAG: hypothetical protein K2J62_10425 [Bacteroidales bacterium]|nr:hypothetical protein [Bacteroidales bacterium]